MTFTLKLIFTGLVTFVPVMDPQDPTKLAAVWVLMVNAMDDVTPICNADNASSHHLTEHFPRMIFNTKYTGAPIGYNVPFPLEDIDVRLDVATGEELPTSCFNSSDKGDIRRSLGQRVVNNGVNSVQPGAGSCEAFDFSWVADIGKFSPGFARVCRHCLDDIVNAGDTLQEVPGDRIKARIKLTKGFIETTAHTKNQDNLNYLPFTAGSSYQQTLAEEVTLTLVNVEDHVTFELCDFLLDPECKSKTPIKLTPNIPNEIIEVRFCNEVAGNNCSGGGSQQDPENDHFLFFYKLSESVTLPGDPNDPCDGGIVIPRPMGGPFGDPRCPESQMLPF